jgi:hypothetical protein
MFAREPDRHGIMPTARVCTEMLPSAFMATAQTEGITLYEPFGGLCAGLEMVLRNGFVVRRYIYSDTGSAARTVAQHRVAALSLRYPHQLHSGAFVDMFVTLPQDVTHVHTAELIRAGAKDGTWWMMVAGWECQDLSPAGSGAGLHGKHSRIFL